MAIVWKIDAEWTMQKHKVEKLNRHWDNAEIKTRPLSIITRKVVNFLAQKCIIIIIFTLNSQFPKVKN